MLVADYDSDEEFTLAKRLEEQAAEEKAKADAALAAASSSSSSDSSDEDDSDDDDDDDDGGNKQKKGAAASAKAPPVTKLPSALELLETTEAPAFLSVPAGNKAEFDVQPMKAPESRYVNGWVGGYGGACFAHGGEIWIC